MGNSAFEQYNQKRDFSLTPEPEPGKPVDWRGYRFVIHKHDASRLHWDLRLEMDKVLKSWAVPKGPPIVKGNKRLAVHVEDHPLEYADFEGSIPQGQYGAGKVRIWDTGSYRLLKRKNDEIIFFLEGRKLHGKYALIKTGGKNWLLFLMEGTEAEQMPNVIEPMKATLTEKAFDSKDYLFEVKWDGVRAIAHVDSGTTRLQSRNLRDITSHYPELTGLHHYMKAEQAIIDGEIVALNEKGLPSFELLQQRMNLQSQMDIKRATGRVPVVYQIFDILYLDGRSLLGLTLRERIDQLNSALEPEYPFFLSEKIEETGTDFLNATREVGIEGIIAKKAESRYLPGKRTRDWLKIKNVMRQECVISGWTEGKGGRRGYLGALILGLYKDGRLVYCGHAGTGFNEQTLNNLQKLLEPIEIDEPLLNDYPKTREKIHWVKPELVCEVEFLEWTKAGIMRHASYKGLRYDKQPQECVFERPAP